MSFTLFTSDHFTPQLICGVSGFAGCGGLPGEIPGIIPGGAGFPGNLLAMERLLFIALLQRIADPMQLN